MVGGGHPNSGMQQVFIAPRGPLTARLELDTRMIYVSRTHIKQWLTKQGEDYTRTEVGALTGVADLLTKNLLLLSGAAEIPVTVLMGQSPAGLSATGESDVRWFYDRTKSAQERVLLRRHRRVVRVLLAAKTPREQGVVDLALDRGVDELEQLLAR